MHAQSVGDQGGVLSFSDDASLAKLEEVVFLRHRAGQAPVEVLVLEKQHGVGVVDGHPHQSLGVARGGGVGDLEARHVEEPSLGALAVVRPGADPAACGHAHDDVGLLAPTPMDLGEVVDDLVEAARHKVAELHLDHGLLAGNRQPEARTHNG